MSNPGIITEQGYAAGSFGFTEASKEDAKKLTPDQEKEKADRLKNELRGLKENK